MPCFQTHLQPAPVDSPAPLGLLPNYLGRSALHLLNVQVLALTAELASLGGGGDVAVGCCWAAALLSGGDATAEAAAATSLDTCCKDAGSLADDMHQVRRDEQRQLCSSTVQLAHAGIAEGFAAKASSVCFLLSQRCAP